eukprot:g43.t1
MKGTLSASEQPSKKRARLANLQDPTTMTDDAALAQDPLTIAYYVTGHGFGHATRVVEVCRHLIARGHTVHVVTAAPEFVFTRELGGGPGELHLRNVVLDVGAKQHDAISVDRRGSLEQYVKHSVLPREKHLAAEAVWLRGLKAQLVVTDIVPLACAAARAAGVPCAAITNFCWDFVYSEYLTEAGAEHRSVVWQIAEDYSLADVCFRLPGFTPMPAFRDVVDLPLVVRRARRGRAEVRAELGLAEGERLLLFNFGGQAAEWELREDFLPAGWRCMICTALAIQTELPARFMRAERDAYIPDLMLAADAIIGKLGYGTVSEALAHGTPFVFVRRDYFNEEPFLRQLLEVHGFGVEIARVDFFSGNWHAHLARALRARPSYPAPANGGEVAAAKLEELARGKHQANPNIGAIKLQDAVVFGYKMLRAGPSLNVPDWYTQGLNPTSPRVRSRPHGASLGGPDDLEAAEVAPAAAVAVPRSQLALVPRDTTGPVVPADTAEFLRLVDALREHARRDAEGATPPRPDAAQGASAIEWAAALGLFDWGHGTGGDGAGAGAGTGAGAGPADVCVARAPGRLDVMGGIADYSGSAVLQLPVAEACHVAVQLQPAASQPHWQHELAGGTSATGGGTRAAIRIVSLNADATNRSATFDLGMEKLLYADEPADKPPAERGLSTYARLRALLTEDSSRSWAAYVAGAVLVLAREKGVSFDTAAGLSLLVDGRVPDGKGVSSSASIEVASMQAISAAAGVALDGPRELAILCQKVENLVVGAPCGVMDQMASAVGQEGQLMAMDCRPAEVRGNVPIPTHIKFWGIDSGIRHSVGGADYGTVRVGAFMGRRMIAVEDVRKSGGGRDSLRRELSVAEAAAMLPAEADERYLATVPPSAFAARYEASLPAAVRGDEFLRDFGAHGDAVTRIEAGKTYAVRQPAAHPVFENFRVKTFQQLLAAPDSDEQLTALGELMYQSHASYSLCGLGSDGTDRLVELVRDSGAGGRGALFGAKITGGGSGGTVCVLGRNNAEGEAAIVDIVAKYTQATGHRPFVFSGSSPGAGSFGVLHVPVRQQ